jgi:uncharacterized protein
MFEWDQAKSEENLAKRGFDFAYASRILDGDVLEWEDTRRDYGEPRIVPLERWMTKSTSWSIRCAEKCFG